MRMINALLMLPLAGLVAACAAHETAPAIVTLRGVQSPEDMAVLDPQRRLLLSQMRGFSHAAPSNIATLDVATGKVRVLTIRAAEAQATWGDASCNAPDSRPGMHGFDLWTDEQGVRRLLQVNHGTRETVERYHLVQNAEGEETLVWDGCVAAPKGLLLNDVAALPNGGFVATIMGEARHFPQHVGLDFLLSGAATGDLVEWQTGAGYRVLPGSRAAFPNGVVATRDGTTIFYAAWTGRSVIRYDRAAGTVTGAVELDFMPDNLTWTAGGAVLAAGIRNASDARACVLSNGANCAVDYAVAAVDPRDLSVSPLHTGSAGETGGASVAVLDGDVLFIGGFATDRVLRLDRVTAAGSRRPGD